MCCSQTSGSGRIQRACASQLGGLSGRSELPDWPIAGVGWALRKAMKEISPRCSGATFAEEHGDADDDGSNSEDADDGCPQQGHEHRSEEQQQQDYPEYLERRPVPLAELVRHYGVSSCLSSFTMTASRGLFAVRRDVGR